MRLYALISIWDGFDCVKASADVSDVWSSSRRGLFVGGVEIRGLLMIE